MIAKKKFGQNFLKDESVVDKIIQSMSCKKEHKLVEIGPGLGDLTSKLLHVKDVIAYEVDDDMSVYLKTHFQKQIEQKSLKILEIDVLKAWENKTLLDEHYDIVANLPYYIATAIILRALKDKMCKNMTLMIQKEVALKFCAKPKDKNFCALSVLASSIAKVSMLFDVPACAFEPMPKVISSVIRFEKHNEYEDIFTEGIEEFEIFLKRVFSQPRKTLFKNLSSFYEKSYLQNIFEMYDFALHVRAHEIDTKTYHRLYKTIKKGDTCKQKAKTK